MTTKGSRRAAKGPAEGSKCRRFRIAGPFGLAALGDRVYVTNFDDDTVSVIDTASHTVVETVAVGDSPLGVALSGDPIYIANTGDGTASVLTSVSDDPPVVARDPDD